jgi:hypothetical protein
MSSSVKINILVKRDGEDIGQRPNSPVRKLPDGTAGVVVNGLVYPVHRDYSVDLVDEGVPKEHCPQYFQYGETIIFAPLDDADDWWFFERSSAGAYLAFDGSDEFAERLDAAFKAEGLSRGYRESFRPAKNGKFYDFYIRLTPDVDEKNAARVIALVESTKHATKADDYAELFQKIEALTGKVDGFGALEDGFLKAQKDRIKELEETIAQQDGQLIRLKSELESERKERSRISVFVTQLQSSNERLEKENGILKINLKTTDISWDDEKSREIDRLRYELDAIHNELSSTNIDLENANNVKLDFERANTIMRIEYDNIKNKLQESRPTQSLPNVNKKISKKVKQTIYELLSCNFPRLIFRDVDYDNLINQFETITDCVRIFEKLQKRETLKDIKKWKDIEGVFEIAGVKTGIPSRGSMGRIYYRSREEKIDIAVHVKIDDNEQERFVKRRFI